MEKDRRKLADVDFGGVKRKVRSRRLHLYVLMKIFLAFCAGVSFGSSAGGSHVALVARVGFTPAQAREHLTPNTISLAPDLDLVELHITLGKIIHSKKIHKNLSGYSTFQVFIGIQVPNLFLESDNSEHLNSELAQTPSWNEFRDHVMKLATKHL